MLPAGRCFDMLPHHGRHAMQVDIGPLAYRDDLAIGIASDNNRELLGKVGRAARVVQAIHEQFHMKVNFAASKTEVAISLIKPDAKPIWQGLRQVGQARQLSHPAVAISGDVTLS
eukprot:1145706-Amphidinium_carterae.1